MEPGNPECLSDADRLWRIALWPVSIRKVKTYCREVRGCFGLKR